MNESKLLPISNEAEKSHIESPQEYRYRKISHYVIYFTITSSSLYYSVMLVSLWPYLNHLDSSADKQFLGYLAAIGAIGTTLFCPLFGKWSNSLKSCRTPFLFTLICGAVHYIIYVSLPLIHRDSRRNWFLFARFMTGMHDINIGLARGYIAESTLRSERRKAVSILTGLQTVAFACGPLLQSLMVPLKENGFTIFGGYVRIDMYTSIGWLALITIVINIIIFLPAIFQHKDVRHMETSTSSSTSLNQNYKLIAWIFIFLQFWLICNYLYLKVLGTPIVMDGFAMNRPDALQFNSYIMTGGAIVSLVAIAVLDMCCKKFGEMDVMYLGFLIMIVGRFLMYPSVSSTVVTAVNQTEQGCPQWSQEWCMDEKQMSQLQFILSNVLDNFGYSWAITIIYTKFSQVLGTKQQGTWMGFMTSFSGLARILSPVVLSYLYVLVGNRITMLISNFVFIGLIVATLWAIKHWTQKGSVNSVEESCEMIDQNGKEMNEIIK
ncbi:major facilitator superfamily domain-containing protein 8-like [Atheta coriaria]|uniref:major facilitator superfamily domain-containing protein 8-like n=1 Tax=Dalotia coriaria TaxID=877792 RepID=UPI0031F3D63C